MTTSPTSERELRAALLSRAPSDLDCSEFRSQLNQLIADATPVSADVDVAVIHDLVADQPVSQPTSSRRRARIRVSFAATIAACAAAIIALVVAILPSGSGPQNQSAVNSGVPQAIRSLLQPGTVVLGTYRGSGNRTLTVQNARLRPFYQYAAYLTCSGGGGIEANKLVLPAACEGVRAGTPTGVGGVTLGGARHDQITITADARTSWVATVVTEPKLRTNAAVQQPVESNLAGPDNGTRKSGVGSATVTFTGGNSGRSPALGLVTVLLVCQGTGVSFPGLQIPSTKQDLVTKTCFPGVEYTWNLVNATLPGKVRIEASPDTRWTVIIE